MPLRWFAFLLALTLTSCRPEPAPAPAPPAPQSQATTSNRFDVLLGRWVRPDGGYVIDVTKVEPDGRVQAAYYNPNPIHVSNARSVWEGQDLKLFVELRGAGYPGSTYTLTYNPDTKRLEGSYFQAAMNETYQVFFVRPEE